MKARRRKYITEILVLLFIICLISPSQAFTCIDRRYEYSHLELNICFGNPATFETDNELYKIRGRLLNDYIILKVDQGRLEKKKVHFNLAVPYGTAPMLIVESAKESYVIDRSELLSLDELVQLVDYLSSPAFRPVDYNFMNLPYTDTASPLTDSIEAFMKRLSPPIMPSFKSKEITAWKKDDIKIAYRNDSLPVRAELSLPVKIKDRYLLCEKGNIYVYNRKKVIAHYKITKEEAHEYYYFEIKAKNNEVHVQIDLRTLLVYFYDSNEFKKIKPYP
jgi:hypothetical protein